MNYFKCLFTLLLSVGIVSSVFAQELSNEEIQYFSRCISGSYSNATRSALPPFEVEIGFQDSGWWGFKERKVIFLVKGEEGEQLCTLYTDPEIKRVPYTHVSSSGPVQSSKYTITPSSSSESIGNIRGVLAIEKIDGGVDPRFHCDTLFVFVTEESRRKSTGIHKIRNDARSLGEIKKDCGL